MSTSLNDCLASLDCHTVGLINKWHMDTNAHLFALSNQILENTGFICFFGNFELISIKFMFSITKNAL